MKQNITLKQIRKTKQNFYLKNAQSLKILSYSNDELLLYLKDKMYDAPFFTYETTDPDAFLNYEQHDPSLSEAIMKQVHISSFDVEEDICEYLIANLDSNGYFTMPYKAFLKQSPYNKETLQYHLAILRTLEPHGTFAFHLKDCLQIQCKLSQQTEAKHAFLLCDYLEEVALHDFDFLKEKTKLNSEMLNKVISFLRSLNPKPAANYTVKATYTNPEFKIEVKDKQITIHLLHSDLNLVVDDTLATNKIFQAQRLEINGLMSAIKKRNATLLQIMQSICEIQSDFFLHNKPCIPCTLETVAKKCGLHISTISRAITNKSCEFEHQYYNLNTFFQAGGIGERSAKTIEAIIVQLIQNEDPHHPLSDESIKDILHKQDILIARRTVAKYREKNYIFNSTKRKQK